LYACLSLLAPSVCNLIAISVLLSTALSHGILGKTQSSIKIQCGTHSTMHYFMQEASSSISGMLSLQSALVDQNPALAAKQTGKPADNGAAGGGVCGELWRRIEASYLQTAAFRNSSLDRWHRKTLVGSGSATLKGNMQMLNQSVSSQVFSSHGSAAWGTVLQLERATSSTAQKSIPFFVVESRFSSTKGLYCLYRALNSQDRGAHLHPSSAHCKAERTHLFVWVTSRESLPMISALRA
jgi:hypothetical protein